MKKLRGVSMVCKILFVAACFVTAGLNHCEGQTIVGKWKMVSTTTYFTAEGSAKQGGKTSIVNQAPANASTITEFKSDHTYLTTTSSASNPAPTTLGGTWSLSNDKLTVTVDAKYHPAKGVESSTVTILITANALMITNNIGKNPIVTKMVTRAERI